MQTATSWLEKEFIKLEATIGVHGKMYELIEQAKEIEKQQIIKSILMWDVHTTLKEEDKGSMSEIEEFVNETYGSKGSDDIKGIGSKDINGNEFVFPTYSQTEISDEEIEKEANNLFAGDLMWSERIAFKVAIKWYREQLKKKQ